MHKSRTLFVATVGALVVAATLAAGGTPASAAASQSFFSSFEPADPQPTWTNTVDAGKSSGVVGPKTTGIPGNVTDKVVEVTANGENAGSGEVKENLTDGDIFSKWLVFQPTGWVVYKLSEPVKVVLYALGSANDAPERDPQDWTFQGSSDGQTWTTLDTQTGQSFDSRFQMKQYPVANDQAYLYYRLDITQNHGTNIVQLAEWQLSNGASTPPQEPVMRSATGKGPSSAYNAKTNVGFSGVRALQYGGEQTADGRGYSYNKVFDVDVAVTPQTELSYDIFPEFEQDDLSYPSTYASVDLAFTDGTFLSDLGATDQHGATLSPQGQGASKTLYTNQWNHLVSRIGDVAAGKTIDRILVAYDNPDGPADFGGWIDDLKIDGSPIHQRPSHLSDWVVTTRGTNSSGSFSRGNNIPATAVPHGFNFWAPATNAGTRSWFYEYQRGNNAQNLPTIQAFEASHEPSPWMGDRQTFQVMPSGASGIPNASRSARALPFRHANETAKPHYYGVAFENGMKTEIAPTDHAAIFRFTFTGGSSNVIFDNVNEQAGITIDQANGVVTGWSDVRSGLSNGATRMFMYATFDKPVTASGKLSASGRDAGYVKFDTTADKTVTMRIATSLVGVAQARHNLELEVAPTDTFDTVEQRAQQQWDRKLGVIEVEGASDDQLTTLYSNLYRLNLYPNSAFENTGTNASPVYVHAMQSSSSFEIPAGTTATETGAPLVPGKVYVNNGFWDTYRTIWSAYSLLYPKDAGELVDGFVQHYRDGGWLPRWSSPGYANLMTGTSADVAFTDAYVKGIRNLNVKDVYDSALEDATVAPPGPDPNDTNVGRKGLQNALFLGYTPTSVDEGVSWALEGDINDFGIANMAKLLAADANVGATAQKRYQEESEYFFERARNYVNVFDPAIGFFQGRAADGEWKSTPAEFDPLVWGHERDYTETDGWNFAFHVPQDGRGLANLYGGRDRLAAKLDTFFATPETANYPGSYGGIIHEMIEARDVRMGQWGFSNQVSHHIPYMYDYAGQPWKTQEKVREALRRLYLGSEIGQGYAGDEDNGETSAWYIFSALGLYPLQVGSPYYAIGSPLFTKATVHLENGHDLVVSAPNNSARNVYVQGLMVNGGVRDKAYLSQADIANGGTLVFAMGSQPSQWGTTAAAAPPSITTDDSVPRPLRDALGGGSGVVTASSGDAPAGLVDDNSGTDVSLDGSHPWIQYRFAGDTKQQVRFYTLTSGSGDAGADPRSWVVKGSDDGASWKALDERQGETFQWRSQTRVFKLARPGMYAYYRIDVTGNGGAATTTLAELELLNNDKPSPLSVSVPGVIAGAGESAAVDVVVSNTGDAPASGQIAFTSSDGWTVTPATAAFGPIRSGSSQHVTFHVAVPAGTEPGDYAVQAVVTSKRGTGAASGAIHVSGDVIEFTPFTSAEQPWLFDADGSQSDGSVFDGHARYADGNAHFTYRFELPSDVTGGTLTLDIGNQYLVEVSPDNQTWSTVLEATGLTGDTGLMNRAERSLDLNDIRGGSRTLYVRISDDFPSDGWGGWLAHVRLETQH
ncbi:MAG: GH92 family glycosyl hydrolase [Gaiellaceae bacterium]